MLTHNVSNYSNRVKVDANSLGVTIRRDSNESVRVTDLYSALTLPSYTHSYSLAIEYMYKWFAAKFSTNFFRGGIYIDSKYVLDEYKQLCKTLVKKENPKARIQPTLDFDYDREGVDVYNAPPEVYIRRSQYQDSFFKDHERNLYLGFGMRAMRMNFNFKVRVNTRAQQLDLMSKMELAFRVGSTQHNYISVDFHVPKSIILNIASRAGFRIIDTPIGKEVENVLEFLNYLNRHSDIPFLFKIRAINQKPEFFIRINDLYTHISVKDKLQKDDGERDGKLDFNFCVDMDAVLTMPVPHYYVLYSQEVIEVPVDLKEMDEGTIAMYSVNVVDIPYVDEHGFNQAAVTAYSADKGETELDLSPLFTGENVLTRVINHDMAIGISPSKYINVKVYREDAPSEYKVMMDWNTKHAKILREGGVEVEGVLQIVMYYDREYVNNLDIEMQHYNNSRIDIVKHNPATN